MRWTRRSISCSRRNPSNGTPLNYIGLYGWLGHVKGKLYSTTETGGMYHKGTVFTITPSGTVTVLYSFQFVNDGAHSAAPLINVKGLLYGNTFYGCHKKSRTIFRIISGTIFRITTGGTETLLHRFGEGIPNDGTQAVGSLINVNGTLYGTTELGGTSGDGTIFSITTSG